MALTVSSPRVFDGNAGKQGFHSDSTGSKCLCCPYGYHIDLDFVRYCEAVAADTTSDNKSTIERRKKRERRRQCQSMEILLGLVDPVLEGLENQLPEIAQDNLTGNGVTTLPRSCHTRPLNVQHTPALDLSDVVGDFEATLRRLSKPSKPSERKAPNEIDGINPPTNVQINQHTELATDFDNASIGSGNSNLSTGALQSIREQMAVSLERMRELEEQVKAIPMLQVQVSVLKEEKRNLQRQVEELNESKINDEDSLSSRYRSNSLSLTRSNNDKNTPKTVAISTRDMGIMCGVMTRDVGVSHQQVRTRDVGMITSTPLARGVGTTRQNRTILSESSFDTKDLTNYMNFTSSPRTTSKYELEDMRIERMLPCYPRGPVSLASLNGSGSPDTKRKNVQNLRQSPIKCETILPDVCSYKDRFRCTHESRKDSSTNTEKSSPTSLQRSTLRFDEILPRKEEAIVHKPETRNSATETILGMQEIHSPDDIARIVEDAIKIYQESIEKEKASKYTQCTPEVIKLPEKKDQEVQVSEPFKMRMNVGTSCKPRTMEVGTDVGPLPGTRSIASGPDPVATTNVISLNSMNSLRSHSFNYGDTRLKRKTTKSVASLTEGLVKMTARSTETTDLQPKKRDFGTSPLKKIFVDVSVGDSLKPHIAISCAANYCDNCKETIKNLAKQMSNNSEIHCNNQNTAVVSRIPRPSHINLGSPDHRRQFKRQDTYTKIPASGVIRYDADNRDHYEANNRLQQQETEEIRNEKKESKESGLPEKEIEISDEKNVLSDSELFQPINEKPREKVEPSKEMRAAMKVLNDNLKKSPSKNISHQTKNATNVIQQEWFKISSIATANPLDVEDYLDCFEEFSSQILEYIVNMTDSSGNTAMHYAVSHGNFDVVSILLDSKVCDINKANVAGYTAVMLAALADLRNSTHASVANRLFQLADVNIRAKLHGQTALMLAVSHGRKDMTRLLLDAGAAVNIQDEDGSTALMCAAEHGYTDIVRLLLAHPDCDSSIVDVDGSSALKIALEAGNRDIGVLLYAHEHVNRGTSPYSSMRRSRRGSKPTTPTGPSPSAPVSPAPSRRFNSSTISLNSTKYSGK
ncbi:KN motif and ankyrin repeat domain-containing protein 2 isoform X2 [Venturia canescens]|nr:KN motif and ankyrin repeat domain-containing protein 2 isoform X2 [Venturia canescens]XP_043281491.1 KN motif and ankyrin repeat domain-containing protein 2 isoform X2 [Venturia canescens]